MQPRPRHRQLAHDRVARDPHVVGDLLPGHTAEEAQLHNARLAFVEFGEASEGVVEEEDVEFLFGLTVFADALQRDALPVATPLLRVLGARVVDEDTAHDAGGHREVLEPLEAFAFADAQKGFVHEGGRLERVVRALLAHEPVRDRA